MKKILMLLCAFDACVIANKVAAADPIKPIVYRQSANRYSVIDEGVLTTRDCTVTADGMPARIDRDAYGAYIVFLDSEGNEEGQCELAHVPPTAYHQARLGFPRQAAVRLPAARTVKVATK